MVKDNRMALFRNFLVTLLITASVRADSVTQASYDADYYFFYSTYKSSRNPLYVGVNNLTSGSPYQYHFNVAAVKFELNGLLSGGSSYLRLNLMQFRVPGAVVPGYQGPPTYSYFTNGYNFDLKVVALGADFSEIESLSGAEAQDWYTTNLLNRPTLGVMSFNSAGSQSIDVSSTIAIWLTNQASNFGFGLVGIPTSGGTEGLTAQFYATESTNNPSLGPALLQTGAQTPLQAWMVEKGFSSDSLLKEDSDHDGLSNLMEFFLGRDPWIHDSSSAFSGKIQNGQLVLQFARRAGENLGVQWEVRASESLSLPMGSWTTNSVSILEGVLPDGRTSCQASVPVTNDMAQRFLRLVLWTVP